MTRWIIGAVAAGAALIAVVVVVATGSGSAVPASPAQASSAAAPDPAAMAAFSDCMSERGAGLPDAPAGAPSALDAKTRKALEACSTLMPAPPSGAPGDGHPPPGGPGFAPTPEN